MTSQVRKDSLVEVPDNPWLSAEGIHRETLGAASNSFVTSGASPKGKQHEAIEASHLNDPESEGIEKSNPVKGLVGSGQAELDGQGRVVDRHGDQTQAGGQDGQPRDRLGHSLLRPRHSINETDAKSGGIGLDKDTERVNGKSQYDKSVSWHQGGNHKARRRCRGRGGVGGEGFQDRTVPDSMVPHQEEQP
ncbi:hypothetical protein PG994_004429 [Apiospora phragmitis]|uniref:Uncharacterized protein n=1 Tax=Apiospora phragmitis TaxID=2905665 RepID=A0ABR1VQK0_9PEZI